MRGTLLQCNDLEAFGIAERVVQQRRFDPLLLFLKSCEQMLCACQLMTYEAGGDAAERRPKGKYALLLQILLQIGGSG